MSAALRQASLVSTYEQPANQVLENLVADLETGRFDPDLWTRASATNNGAGLTLFSGRVADRDVVLRRLRTASGGVDPNDYFYRLRVMAGDEVISEIRSDHADQALGQVVEAVEKLCTFGAPITNNYRFTQHVIESMAAKLVRDGFAASDWEVDGPYPSGTANGDVVTYTTTVGGTEVTLARNGSGWAMNGAARLMFSLTVRRSDIVIGLRGDPDPASDLGTVVAQVAALHSLRVEELQSQANSDLSGL